MYIEFWNDCLYGGVRDLFVFSFLEEVGLIFLREYGELVFCYYIFCEFY